MKDFDGRDLTYKMFPKGDARRYLLVLLTIHRLRHTGATTHSVAAELGATRAEVGRAITKLSVEFGVVFRKNFSQYVIESWGIVDCPAAIALVTGKTAGAVLN